jgi:hypothetical protein
VFSDNRPELVQPYFQTILNQVELGQWRASMPFWGSGTSSATPGFWAQDFNHMSDLATNKSFPFVQAGYAGVQFPTHFSPWKHFYFVSDWGQKNVGAFTTKAFMDYYDYTLNVTFLRQTLYPLTKLNGAFYASYMTKIGGKYNVMHSCAMEGCGAQGPLTGKNIAVSNNPPFDLAFVKRTFRGLLEYSRTLGVDSHMHAQWQTYLDNVAEYPLTKDENGNTVFAQATLNSGPTSTETDGFPNASKCQWNPVVNAGGEGPKCGPCALHCPNKSATPVGGCSYPCKTGSGNPQTCCAPCHHSESDDRIGVRSTSDCGNARYPITFFNAIHPGEDVDLASDATTLAIARSTTSVVNAINDYSPTNGLCMAWPASARVVSAPFPSWNRSILTEIYLCHACSYHEIEDGNGAPGQQHAGAPPALRHSAQPHHDEQLHTFHRQPADRRQWLQHRELGRNGRRQRPARERARPWRARHPASVPRRLASRSGRELSKHPR